MRRLFLFSLLFSALTVFAQDRGTITGTVTDASGAAVPGASVTVTNPATGLSQTTVTGSDGTYSLVYLPVGKYSVAVEKQGFKKNDVGNVQVLVNTTTRVDTRLQVGTLAESVEVTGTAPLLQTDRSDLGRVVENVAIERLPLFANGGLRSNNAFVLLNPGANATITSDPDITSGAPRVSGGVAYGNSQLLDGAESMSERRNDPQMRVVSAEGIQEFKVQTGAYSAEYGRTSNGVMNYTTKSGTNEFHGTLFGVLRNNALNAKGFYYGAHTPAVHNQNLEAASVGGPVYVPKVFDGRNKVFFFFSGERSRAKDVNAPGLISTAVQDFRNGDFRRYVGSQGVVPLYDPFDAAGNLITDASKRPRMECNGVLNVICPDRISPVAKFIDQLNYYPLPDNPDQIFNNTYDRTNGSRTPGENQGVYSIKGDYFATQKLRFNGLFSKTYFNSYPLQGAIPGPVSEGFQEFGNFKWVRANVDYVVRPNLLNHFTFGYNLRDLGEDSIAPDKTYHDATLLPGVNTKVPNYTKYQTEFGNFGSHVWTRSPGRTWNIQEQVAWLKGRHSFKFGFDYIRPNYARNDCNSCAGVVSTSSSSTGNPGVSGTTGIGYASFLLGLASSANFNFSADINFIYRYYAWYFQDDIKLSSKLTMNVGLRYDLPFTRYEPNHQNSNFNPSLPNPGAGGLLGAMEFAGSGPGRSGRDILEYTRHDGFGPRLGFAYQLTPKTVIRAGGSVVYDSIREDGNADSGIQGFGGSYSAPSNYFSTGIALLFSTGFTDPSIQPLVNAAKPVHIDPTVANFSSPTYRTGEAGMPGYYADYNFTVERSITASTLWRGSFHANYGIKVQANQNFDQLDPRYWSIYGTLLGSSLSNLVNAAGVPTNSVLIANGFQLPYAGYPLNLQLNQALRPYPQYSGVSGPSLSGHSTYNALETSLEHRFNQGFYVLASYTFSKAMSSNQGQNVYTRLTDKAVAGFDRTHIFALSYIYDLPIGKGKPLLGDANPILNAFLGNWSVSAVHRYQTGNPMTPGCGQQVYNAGSARCNFVPGEPLYNPNWNPDDPTSTYINPKAFVQPANMTYGNLPAVLAQLRQPSQLNEDVAVSKMFRFGHQEARSVEFRASAFNVANRHLLGGITTSATSSTFGRITNPQSNQPRNVEFNLRFTF